MENYESIVERCPICDSRRILKFHKDFRNNLIYKCHSCEIQFMNPQYTDEYLDSYYSGYIDHESDKKDEPARAAYGIYLKALHKYSTKKGKMLDYGCGAGRFMIAAKTEGWEVFGYDVDCDGTKKLAEKTGAEVWCGDPSVISEANTEKFDLISMHQVLEHIKNPNEALRGIVSMLKTNGYLMISVPNICSLSSRFKTFLERNDIRKHRIGAHYSTDHHLFYYCPNTLKRLLSNHGLEVLWKRNGHKGDIGESKLTRFLRRNIVEHLYSNSTFVVIAKKVE